MSDSQTVVYVAATLEQAHLLENILRDEGIVAHVMNEALQIGLGHLPFGVPAAPRVVVGEPDAQQARRIALEFERITRRGPPGPDRAPGPFQFWLRALFYVTTCFAIYFAVDKATAGTPANDINRALVLNASIALGVYLIYRRKRIEWDKCESQPADELVELEEEADAERPDWPTCPGCGRPRHTSCPVCETAGSGFTVAFVPEGPEKKHLVLCPTCDEAFEPEFLAQCEWCGHQFGDGRELPASAEWTSPFDEMGPRAWIVLAGLLIFFASLFWLIIYAAPRP